MTATALYHRQPYTPDEIDHIREHYRQIPLEDLAADLGRNPHAVDRKAREMGLHEPREPKSVWIPRLRALHREGRCTAEIGEVTGWPQALIRQRLRIIGLKPNLSRSRQHAVLATKAKYQGYSSWGAYMAMRRRVRAGFDWPGCKSQSEVAICRCLSENWGEFATVEDIAVKTGLSYRCVQDNAKALVADAILERKRVGTSTNSPYTYKLAERKGAYHTLKIERETRRKP